MGPRRSRLLAGPVTGAVGDHVDVRLLDGRGTAVPIVASPFLHAIRTATRWGVPPAVASLASGLRIWTPGQLRGAARFAPSVMSSEFCTGRMNVRRTLGGRACVRRIRSVPQRKRAARSEPPPKVKGDL